MGITIYFWTLLMVPVVGASLTHLKRDKYVWCDGNPADLFFLIDSSTSIWIKHFRIQREFLKNLVQFFPLGTDQMRVGLAVFSDRFYKLIDFDKFNNTDDLQDAIGRIPHIYGSTNTGEALKKLRTEVFPEARKNVTRIAVVITDGVSYNRETTKHEAELLRKSGVFVFAIGVGSGPNMTELRNIGSSPSNKFVFKVAGFDVLDKIREELAYKACKVTPDIVLPYCAAKRPTDIIFGFDSAAMGEYRSAHVKELIVNVTGYFGNMEDDTMRVGVLSGQCNDRNILLNEHNSKEDLISDIKNVSSIGLSEIFENLVSNGYTDGNGGREMARKMAVIVIDDSTEDMKDVVTKIVQARSKGIEVFIIAIGDDHDLQELTDVLDLPVDKHLVTVETHKELDTIKDDYSELFCQCVGEETTQPPI